MLEQMTVSGEIYYQQVEIGGIVKLRADSSPWLMLIRCPLPLDPGRGQEAGWGRGEGAGEPQQAAGCHRHVVAKLTHLACFILLVNKRKVRKLL